ncbi:MAG TPA: hypothetical protein VMB85_13970 [Bryobacteraceae bacterium]|nr:hypothetical protein [Bryobacteraceae bacterium]
MTISTGDPRLFVDTWGWLALADAGEALHAKVVEERRRRTAPGMLITTDYVLDETLTRLFSRADFAKASAFSQAIFASASAGLLLIERIDPARFEAAYRMRLRYRDKDRISFTDFTSFVVMKDLGVRDVLTADEHFVQVQLGFRRVPAAG